MTVQNDLAFTQEGGNDITEKEIINALYENAETGYLSSLPKVSHLKNACLKLCLTLSE
jgi:hypothetical protein